MVEWEVDGNTTFTRCSNDVEDVAGVEVVVGDRFLALLACHCRDDERYAEDCDNGRSNEDSARGRGFLVPPNGVPPECSV